jgi:hypothetical protein
LTDRIGSAVDLVTAAGPRHDTRADQRETEQGEHGHQRGARQHDLACASLGFVEDESEQTRKSLLELLAAQAIESPGPDVALLEKP